MERWLKFRPREAKESTKDNENIELETFASGESTSLRQQCTSFRPDVKSMKKCKYDHNYLNFAFTYFGNEEYPDSLCLLCNKIFSNSLLAPAKLKRHFETNHPSYKNKDIGFFMKKLQTSNSSRCLIKSLKQKENAIEASYKASYCIALAGKDHSIDESLIQPVTTDVVSYVLDEASIKKIKLVSLSNNTVSRRMEDIASNIEMQLVSRLPDCDTYALQLDKSIDVAGFAILLVLV